MVVFVHLTAAIKKCPINGWGERERDVIYATLDRLATNQTFNYKALIMSSDEERANSESEPFLYKRDKY